MVRPVGTGLLLGLVLAAGGRGDVAAQTPVPRAQIKENVPNPVVTTTTIPFQIGSETCKGGRRAVVSMRIFNVLAQQVAVLRLENEQGPPLEGIVLSCGSYTAFWDGRDQTLQRDVPAGVYYVQLVVNGRRFTRKLVVQREVAFEEVP